MVAGSKSATRHKKSWASPREIAGSCSRSSCSARSSNPVPDSGSCGGKTLRSSLIRKITVLVRVSRTMQMWMPAGTASLLRLSAGQAFTMGSMPMRLAATFGQTVACRTTPGARSRRSVWVMIIWEPATAGHAASSFRAVADCTTAGSWLPESR